MKWLWWLLKVCGQKKVYERREGHYSYITIKHRKYPMLPSSSGLGRQPPQAGNGGSNPSGSANSIIEQCAVVALEQRCERKTPWDQACVAIAREIRKLKA